MVKHLNDKMNEWKKEQTEKNGMVVVTRLDKVLAFMTSTARGLKSVATTIDKPSSLLLRVANVMKKPGLKYFFVHNVITFSDLRHVVH